MNQERRRVLFLATGGTFGMVRRRGSDTLEPAEPGAMDLGFLEPLRDLCELDARVIASIDSSDMTPALWERLGAEIAGALDSHDGFVVLHGTDTMAYTATALSYMLEGLPKPVILTGSQRPRSVLRTDADANLVHSTHCATLDLPEVGLYFGTTLLRGNRATKTSVQAYTAFASPNFPPLLEMGVEIEVKAPPLRPQGPFRLRPGFSTELAVLGLFPGLDPALVDRLIDGGARAILLRGFGEGNLPRAGWPELVRRACARGVPVIVASQCTTGRVSPGRYQNSAMLRDAGAVFTEDMTVEAATVKTMWMLGQGADLSAFQERFTAPLAGECSSPA